MGGDAVGVGEDIAAALDVVPRAVVCDALHGASVASAGRFKARKGSRCSGPMIAAAYDRGHA